VRQRILLIGMPEVAVKLDTATIKGCGSGYRYWAPRNLGSRLAEYGSSAPMNS
jgi:hypothetical protein